MDALVAFAAALLALRLAGLLAARYRSSGRPELLAWSAGLAAYAVAAAAIAWGEAAGWDGRAFRVYYAAGALLTAPLLGAGSLLLAGRRRAAPAALVYVGLAGLGAAGSAIGIAVGAVLLYAGFVVPTHIPPFFRPKMAPR